MPDMPTASRITPPTVDVSTCCGQAPPTPIQTAAVATKFHFSLNVADLERSADFYGKLPDADRNL